MVREVIHCDGSAYNGVNSALCVIKKGKKKKHVEVFYKDFNVYEIEYLALIKGLTLASPGSIILSDNYEIVKEVNLILSPKSYSYFCKARNLMIYKNLKVEKIEREKNLAGIYLDKRLAKIKKERFLITHPRVILRKIAKTKNNRRSLYTRIKKI